MIRLLSIISQDIFIRWYLQLSTTRGKQASEVRIAEEISLGGFPCQEIAAVLFCTI
jgi:hypothetical protein